jgi:hypothetical protein
LGLPGVQCCFDRVFSLHDWLMELGYLNSRLGGLGPGIDWQAQKSCQQRQTSVQQIQGVEVRALQSRMAQQCHCYCYAEHRTDLACRLIDCTADSVVRRGSGGSQLPPTATAAQGRPRSRSSPDRGARCRGSLGSLPGTRRNHKLLLAYKSDTAHQKAPMSHA